MATAESILRNLFLDYRHFLKDRLKKRQNVIFKLTIVSFRIYDEDRNGKIESRELLKILKSMYSDFYKTNSDLKFDELVHQIYSDFDVNQDGTLTLEAFKIMSLKEPMMTDFVEEFLRLPDQIDAKDRRKSLI
jgi:Ca2+-binding EF-hand superfamily protein